VIGELFRLTAKINIVHAPFQGGGPAIAAAVGGHIPMVLANVSEVVSFAKGGKMRSLAVTTPERAEAMPRSRRCGKWATPRSNRTNWSGLVVPLRHRPPRSRA